MIFEQVVLLHLFCDMGEKDQRYELNEELPIKALFRRDSHPAQIQPFFQVIKGLFHQILVAVDLKRLH